MIINRSGITIRIKATDIKVIGRATQGLSLINLSKKGDQIASGTVVPHVDDEQAEGAENEPNNSDNGQQGDDQE